MVISDYTLSDERVTIREGKEYRLRPTLKLIFQVGMLVQTFSDAFAGLTVSEEAREAIRAVLHEGMQFHHSAEEIDHFVDTSSGYHVVRFVRSISDLPDFLETPPEEMKEAIEEMTRQLTGETSGDESAPLE